MAVRVRKDGRIFCAALRPEEPGDIYIDDELHYQLGVVLRILVSEPMDKHQHTAQWWWKGHVPDGVEIDPFYLEDEEIVKKKCVKIDKLEDRQ